MIEDREREAIYEDFPIPYINKELLQEIVKFCEIVNYEEDLLIKTKPITVDTMLSELFENEDVRKYFEKLSNDRLIEIMNVKFDYLYLYRLLVT
jgi:hypothetical protein